MDSAASHQRPDRPIIGITMGDPCGVGAEIIVKALADRELRRRARFVVFGLTEQIAYTADMLEVSLPVVRDHHEAIRRYPHDLVVLAIGMEPSVSKDVLPAEIVTSASGYIEPDEANGGIFAAGCASDALDVNRAVQHATGSALRAIQVVNRIAGTEG